LWRVITEGGRPPIEDDDEERKEAKEEKKAIKIRVFPTKEQDAKLKRWFGAARWTYNRCVESFKTKACKMNTKEVRSRHVNNEALQDNERAKEVPYDIRDEAMNDFRKAFEATRARAKKDGKRFEFKFRSKKDETQSIVVLKKHWDHASGAYADVFNTRVCAAINNCLPSWSVTLACYVRAWDTTISACRSLWRSRARTKPLQRGSMQR
jgi:uncharacterized protein YndB with AHSA1/START domain